MYMQRTTPIYIVFALLGLGSSMNCWGQANENRAPEILVTTEVIQRLYYQCGNKVLLYSQEGGEAQAMVPVDFEGGSMLRHPTKPNTITLVPQSRTVRLTYSDPRSTKPARTLTYKVVKPPNPTLEVKVNGRIWDQKSPISRKSNIQIRVKPDRQFKRMMPHDARYIIKGAKVMTYGCYGANKIGEISGSEKTSANGTLTVSLSELKTLSREPPGTRIMIQLDGVYRKNFRGKKLPVNHLVNDHGYLSFVLK